MSGKQKPYLIGLDIGDASVGYAVTDINGRLLKHKKRNAWGVMLFDKAEPAHDRRISRSTRRRYDRKEHRIDDLQDLMADDVLSVDPAFYLKMNETFLHPEDSKYPKLYGSMPMHVFEADLPEAKYPTIYHIREALVTRTDQADIRYVYLALHHIMKYRGHFLFNDQPLASLDNDIIVDLQQVMDFLRDSLGYQITEDTSCAPLIKEILQATSLRGSEKRKQILQALQPAVDCYKSIDQLSALLIGQKANLRVLFDDAENEQLPEKISFSGELDEDALVDMLGSNADAFLLLQKIYRWQLFASLRKDGNTISHEMVLRYEKHKRNLALLKKVVRTYCSKTEYWSLFKDSTRVDGYCAYSAQGSSVERCEQEKFYKAIRALLTKERCSNDPDCQCILNSMGESNGFLPLQRINFNGNIPNQFHAEEMRLIIANQAEYYPTLRENGEKILSLCTFRLPYYIGPLNSAPFGWVVRKDASQRIKPWNFDQVVDRGATAEKFILKLSNHCTYLPGEYVLPSHSLLFEEYMLLDELNRVRINGKLIQPDTKKRAIRTLFSSRKHVSHQAFKQWLEAQSVYTDAEKISITGTHKEDAFTASLGSQIDFSSHGFNLEDDVEYRMVEELIRWNTLFEDRRMDCQQLVGQNL